MRARRGRHAGPRRDVLAQAAPDAGMASIPELRDRELLRWIARQVRPFRLRMAVGVFLSFLATPIALLQPVPLAVVVDNVIGGRPLNSWLASVVPDGIESSPDSLLVFAAISQVVVVLLAGAQSVSTQYVLSSTGEHVVLRVRGQLLDHVQRLSFVFHDRNGTAESIYRIQHDAGSVRSVAIDSVVPLLSSAVLFVSILVVIVRLNAELALVALAIAPLLYLQASRYRRRIKPQYRALKRLESSALRVVQEALTSFRVVKAFGRESYETDRFVARSTEGVDARVRLSLREGIFGMMVSGTTAVGTALVVYIGARSVMSGDMTLGALLLVTGYLTQLYGPLESISKRIAGLQSQLVSAQRVHELLSQLPEVVDRPDALPVKRAVGAIEVEDVGFGYAPGQEVLHGVSLSVPAGSRVGIAGRTGAGKTTLVSLLVRFYDPHRGRILLDGIDLRDYKLEDLREQFTIVLQEPVLFSTSIAENIRYARPAATDDQVIAAAMIAGAHDFVSRLPDGYDTLVGERGMSLSGGERQRISLARAFLKDAPILVLDEPTSSVDTQTEGQIMEAMERLMHGRTTFMIAHRLSTLEGCDLRVEMRDGRVMMSDAGQQAG